MKKIVNIIAEINASTLDRYFIEMCTLTLLVFRGLGLNSEIAKFWEPAPLILQPQGTSHPSPP